MTVGLLASVSPWALAAEEALEDRYQKAVQFFNGAKMEDACELFQQIERETPAYKDTHTYLNPACSAAKQAYALEEKLVNEAEELLRANRPEDAKEKFNRASKLALKHPNYRVQIERGLRQIEQLEVRAREEAQFQEAVQIFNQGRNDDAARLFTQIEQGRGTKADEARTYLQRIKERQEDATWNRAVDSFNRGDLPGARSLLGEVIRANGKHAKEAQDYLGRIKAAESDNRSFEEAIKTFNSKRYPDARARFQELIQEGSPHATEARSYLQRIETALREEAAVRDQARQRVADIGQDPRHVAQQFVTEAHAALASGQYVAAVEKLRAAQVLDPANREIFSMLGQAQEMAEEQPLRQGLGAYFQGKYDEAERQLSQYVDNHGRKLGLAYFFRGAAHASRYFLSGDVDTSQKELALADFRTLQKDARQFQPPKDYVSPKILSLYSQAVSGSAR